MGLLLRSLGFDAGYGCFSDEVIDHFLYGRQKSGHPWSEPGSPAGRLVIFVGSRLHPHIRNNPLRFTGAG